MQAFSTLYRKLNPEQKKAVDAIEGPVMVVAGPGTGKTQILTLRIANILQKTDTPPDAILALTFTESAAFGMRKRLVEIIGSAGYRVHIHTFHGFCNNIINAYPSAFPRIIGAHAIIEVDRVGLLEDIIREEALEHLRPFGNAYHYLGDIGGAISSLKREDISPQMLERETARERERVEALPDLRNTKGPHAGKVKGKYQTILQKLEKTAELARLYARYEAELRSRRQYDFEDMIVETIRALEQNSDLLLLLQEEYQYVLADEHQDANNSQNRLLELLGNYHRKPNLFIVGDEKQAIYRFQGASLENFGHFKKLYPSARKIVLRTNYRSTQSILDSAHSLITKSTNPKHLALTAARKGSLPVRFAQLSSPDAEHVFVARDIARVIAEGVPPNEIAVLYRTNGNAVEMSAALERVGVPFVIESHENALADPDVRKLTTLLRSCARFGEEGLLFEVLHADYFGVEPLDVYKLARHRLRSKLSLPEILSSMKELKAAKVSDARFLRQLYGKLSSFATVARNLPALEAIETIVNESGYLSHLLTLPGAAEKLAKVNGLIDAFKTAVAAHHGYTAADLMEYLNRIESHAIEVRKDRSVLSPKRVRLMTAHRAKGLEFDYVYIIGAVDGHWGNRRSHSTFRLPGADEAAEGSDEERRLFYVALTRARVQAMITAARSDDSGSAKLPSQFVEDIDKRLIEIVDTSAFEAGFSPHERLRPRAPMTHSLRDKIFLNEVFAEQGMSVTALNNYLVCPWRYFYSNLLRIPQAPNKHLLFGTAIHSALRELRESAVRGETLSADETVERFAHAAERQPFSDGELSEALAKGEQALRGYYRQYRDLLPGNALVEFKLTIAWPTDIPDLPVLRLRGDLDLLEFISDSEVVVTDSKTGKPKSRNQLLGETKNSDGSYKRQLTFYAFLLSLFEKGKWRMREGVIDFVEPDTKGRYHREHFVVAPEEIDELSAQLRSVAQEIITLDFWDKRCDDKKCSYCALRDLTKG